MNLLQKCDFENIVHILRYWQKTKYVNSCFSRVFRQFFNKFPRFHEKYCAYKIVPSVENIKLLTIIEAKIGQNGRRSKCATFY